MRDDDVIQSFLRLTEAKNSSEVLLAAEADPRLLAPEFEDYLIRFERELEGDGQDARSVGVWRLVLRSLREGRNLYAATWEVIGAPSARAIRDLAIHEPLLLDPLIDSRFQSMARAIRQQGDDGLARIVDSRRELLARFRAHGPVDGYFEILVEELLRADGGRRAELLSQNADIVGDLDAYVMEQLRIANNLGHQDRIQQLVMAMTLAKQVEASQVNVSPALEQLADDAARVVGLALTEHDPDALIDELLRASDLGGSTGAFVVAGVVLSEIDRAAYERDVVRVRKFWVARNLVLRWAEVGRDRAIAEWRAGKLWPQPTDTL